MQRHTIQLLTILCLAFALAAMAGCPAKSESNTNEPGKTAAAPPETEQPSQAQQMAQAEQQPAEQKQPAPKHPYDPNVPLNNQYAALKAKQNQPEEVKQTFADQRAQLTGEGAPDKALHAGDTAPGFTLPADSGGAVALQTALSHGPVVLVFFRGGW